MNYDNERQQAEQLMMSAISDLNKLEQGFWLTGNDKGADKIGFASSDALKAFNMLKEIESKSRIAEMDNKMKAFNEKLKEAGL